MKKICFILIIFSLFVFAGCGDSKKENKNETPDSEATTTDDDALDNDNDPDDDIHDNEPYSSETDKEEPDHEKKRGTLGGRCYQNGTCNIGLVCDTDNDICIKKKEEPADDEPDDDLYESEHLETPKNLNLGKICTNQDKCYNEKEEIPCPAPGEDFYGQDAQYKDKCAKQKFQFRVISGEQVVEDVNTGFKWRKVPMHKTYSLGGAMKHCDNISFADDRWDLPTPQQLLTIIDNGRDHPALNTEFFPEMPDSDDSYLWTGNFCYFNFSFYWTAGIHDGEIMHMNDETTQYFMCMKGKSFPAPSFTTSVVNEDEIVKDSVSGLTWQKNYESNLTWKEALAYCENLEYAGFDDWRLPNKNELATLINYEAEAPASDFPDIAGRYFWTSSSYVSDPAYAWAHYFYDGSIWRVKKTDDDFLVLCVRN